MNNNVFDDLPLLLAVPRAASILGISRDHAKVFNYARIYGAGQSFAARTASRPIAR